MNLKVIFSLCCFLLIFSCNNDDKSKLNVHVSGNSLNVDFDNITLNGGFPGVELLIGNEETPLKWFPKESVAAKKTERTSPKGKGTDFSLTWQHPNGYTLMWNIYQLHTIPGFSVRLSFTNNSKESVRLKDFVLLTTAENGLLTKGDPAAWWLLPAGDYTTYSHQVGNLAQVLPSRADLKNQTVYGYGDVDTTDVRNRDGRWRFLNEVVTLYNQSSRSGIALGAVGPGVSYVNFNFQVENGKLLPEIVSQMDEIVVDPSETRESEEVLIIEQPYKEALTTIFSWVAESHQAKKISEPAYGWCSWYDLFGNVKESDVLNVAQVVKEQRNRIPLNVIQIDDGWQKSRGDWTANEKFPNGMGYVAEKIREAGAVPGIWMAPVSSALKQPAEWFQNGKGSDLDPTHPEVEKFIISSIRKLKEEGYRYYKFDFNTIGHYRPYNPKMTRFQIMRHLYSLYREAIGEDSYLLACAGDMRPVVGLADASRIGWDILPRWKNYQLADHGWSTLPLEVFGGVVTIAMSASLNNILYASDPDVSYLLPRVDPRRPNKEAADSLKNALNWPELTTLHSYIGLLGGTAMVSEPLNTSKYHQHNAVRMLEILNPPAPDKGWSMNGDIDQFGRQFGFVAERTWGKFASVALWNIADTTAGIKLDTHTLKALGPKFHVWSFWDERYLGVGDASYIAKDVKGHGSALLRLTQVSPQQDIPVIVGSNLHISLGAAELESVEASSTQIKIKLTDAGARDGKLFIYSKDPLKINKTTGCDAFIVPQGGDIYALVITDRSRSEKNTIELSRDSKHESAGDLLNNPDLLKKYKKSGLNFDEIK